MLIVFIILQLFVELRGGPGFGASQSLSVLEFFLGVCECAIIREWRLCASSLTQVRLEDCTFQEATSMANSSARIHRRLCDITGMSQWVKSCNCSGTLAKQPLFEVNGFPTCFQSPLPQIMCSSHSPCGLFQCRTNTLYGIHSVLCDPNCQGRQPFCEEVGPITSTPRKVYSYWSEWSTPACNTTCGNGVMYSEAICINIASGKAGLDCLGPGAFCCPASVPNCECHLSFDSYFMKVIRTLSPCPALEPCPVEEDEDIAILKAQGGENELFKQLKHLKKEKHPYHNYLNNKHNNYVKNILLQNHLNNPDIGKQQLSSSSKHPQKEIKKINSQQKHYRNNTSKQDERKVWNNGSFTSKQSDKKKSSHHLDLNILDDQKDKFTKMGKKINKNKIGGSRSYSDNMKSSKEKWKSIYNKNIKGYRFDLNHRKFEDYSNTKALASGNEKGNTNSQDGSINEEIYLRTKQLSKNEPATYNLNFKSYFSIKNPAYDSIKKSYSNSKNIASNKNKKVDNTIKYHKRKLLGLNYPEYLVNDDENEYYFDDSGENSKHHTNEIKVYKRTYEDYNEEEFEGNSRKHKSRLPVFKGRDRSEDEDEDTEDDYMISDSPAKTSSSRPVVLTMISCLCINQMI
ncbi:hypothetical protein C0J52_10949 [Blattella germanica]|nr:hypothetical protein C0J52_10949 [Blattella germanica]